MIGQLVASTVAPHVGELRLWLLWDRLTGPLLPGPRQRSGRGGSLVSVLTWWKAECRRQCRVKPSGPHQALPLNGLTLVLKIRCRHFRGTLTVRGMELILSGLVFLQRPPRLHVKPSQVPAVEVTPAGASYNPTFEDHQVGVQWVSGLKLGAGAGVTLESWFLSALPRSPSHLAQAPLCSPPWTLPVQGPPSNQNAACWEGEKGSAVSAGCV